MVKFNFADLRIGKNVPVKLRLFYIDKGILCALCNIFKYETCLFLHHILLVATKELNREQKILMPKYNDTLFIAVPL